MSTPTVYLKHGRFPYITGDDRALRTIRPYNGGPLMVSDPRIREGRPTNVYNLLAPEYPPVGVQYMPDGSTRTSEELHAEKMSGPGRHSKLTVGQAREARESYWSGKETEAAIGRRLGIKSRPSVWRLVHGITYWYV